MVDTRWRCAPPSAAPSTTAAAPEAVWPAFVEAVAGEWEGVTATFTSTGTPKPLPERYVPEASDGCACARVDTAATCRHASPLLCLPCLQAYREWGIELTDWQSQCSVRADESGLAVVHRRMMPTVGCEADAIAFTQEQAALLQAGTAGNAIAADGSYSTAPSSTKLVDPALPTTALQTCLALAPRQRLRLVHVLRRMGADARWQLAEIELHQERWDGPYTGKLELSGCGGGLDGFATSAPLDAALLDGPWLAHGVRHHIAPSGKASASMVVEGEAWMVPHSPLCLPLNTWSSLAVEDGQLALTAGVLCEHEMSMRVLSRRQAPGEGAVVEFLELRRAFKGF